MKIWILTFRTWVVKEVFIEAPDAATADLVGRKWCLDQSPEPGTLPVQGDDRTAVRKFISTRPFIVAGPEILGVAKQEPVE